MRLICRLVLMSMSALLLLCAVRRASAAGPASPSSSEHCGGPPNYCANSTRNVVPETPMAPPPVNTPFRDPDFGSRMVRVTDANTIPSLTGTSFHSSDTGETAEWSKFDPAIGEHGGYRFFVESSAGYEIPFELDASTMQVTRIKGKHRGFVATHGALPFGSTFSYTNPDVLYGTRGTTLLEYNFATDKYKPVYDFAKCPGLPKGSITQNMHTGEVTSSGDDTKFAYLFGGYSQDTTRLVVFYDRSANGGAGACYWYHTASGTVGGTGMPVTPVANGVGKIAPPAAPQVTPVPGSGGLPPGNYFVQITLHSRLGNSFGETTPSAEVGPIHLASTGSLVIKFPPVHNPDAQILPPLNSGCYANSPGCVPFNVYIGPSSGEETLQNTRGMVGGASYTQSTALDRSSARPPSANNAGFTVHDDRIAKSGRVVRLVEAFTGTEYFWAPGTATVMPCIPWQGNPEVGGYCNGHGALGYAHYVNQPGFVDDMNIVIHPLSNMKLWRPLVSPVEHPEEWKIDNHFSWADANPSDTMPVCSATYVDAIVKGGDGTQNVLTNPVLKITRPWDREIICFATSGPSKVWRFAHDRGTAMLNDNTRLNTNFWAVPIGDVSQDGKFYLFGTDWDWSLGSQRGSSGCPSSGTCRTDAFIVELH